ncbi:tetratricopeptide repeat protein [Verrucomicrobiaceae bacterium 227]
MSQSPLDSGNLSSIGSYQKGWRALNRLLHESKSFSGRETNNAFLNCGDGGRFADISTAIGWDFADDARAIGLIDYDHDGDLDIWVTNRTAPRVRLLRNNLQSDANFVSLHLTGDGKKTNRDGIGSRVEVFLKDSATPVMRTLHAGQSFLSQSSRWLHFGLGQKAVIEKIIVHWPAQAPEEFTGVTANQFFHLVQGTGQATARELTTPIKLTPGEAELPPKTSIARIIPPAGHALPELLTQSGDLIAPTKTSLITLWSRTCPHCQAELTTWAREKKLWHDAGIEVIAFATDQEPRAECDAFLRSIGADFTAEMASPEAVEMLDALQSSFVDLWLPIPVPSSFLVTDEGEILAAYRGPVSREQVLQDAALAKATPAERRLAASPFTGRWIQDQPPAATPQRAAQQLVQRAHDQLASEYLATALTKPFVKGSRFDRADNLLLLGQLLGQQGKAAQAVPHLRAAYQLIPHDIRIIRLLATGLTETGAHAEAYTVIKSGLQSHPENLDLYQDASRIALDLENHREALGYLEKAVSLAPTDPRIRYQLIQVLLLNGQASAAIENCKTILRTQPKFLSAANLLSRILSTHPNEKVRSPEESFALASRLCQISKNRDTSHLFALALAQANLGKFQEAQQLLESLQKVVPKESEMSGDIAHALTQISQKQPVRNPLWKN